MAMVATGTALAGEPSPPTTPPPQRTQTPAPKAALITAERAAAGNLLVILPRKTEMGFVPVGDARQRRVWVINPSETEELRIKALRFDCGCATAPEFQAMTLEPNEARHVDLHIHAPEQAGVRRDIRAFFVLENGDAVFSTIHLETVDIGSAYSIDPPPPGDDVIALPDEHDLGDLPLGERGRSTVWFVNQSKRAKQIEKLRTSCPCLSAPGFESRIIEPGMAMRVDLTLRAETEPLARRRVGLYALDADGLMAEARITYSAGQTPPGEADGWNTVQEPDSTKPD